MKARILLITSVCFASLSFSQITIESDDAALFLSDGKMAVMYSEFQEQILDIGNPGGDNVFNFSGLTFDLTIELAGVAVENTPYAVDFPTADLCLRTIFITSENTFTNFNYFENDEGLDIISSITEITPFPDADFEYYEPFLRTFSYPMTIGTAWTTTSTITPIQGGDVGTPEFLEAEYFVDAYGTLILPDGSEEEALRLRITSTYDQEEVLVDYEFWTLSGSRVLLECAAQNPPDAGEVEVVGVTFNGPMMSLSTRNPFPSGYGLEANFPNPFSRQTALKYKLPVQSDVEITITDLMGKHVASVLLDDQSPGNHNFVLDGANLATGLYIATLQSNRFSSSIKLSKTSE